MKDCKKLFLKWNVIIVALVFAYLFNINLSQMRGMQQVNAASPGGNMDIYGICLSAKNEGDATLIESDGQFLLMDMGKAEDSRKVASFLKKRGAKRITLYVSHYHADHYGGGEDRVADGVDTLMNAGIYIEKLYLPDPSIAKEQEEENTNKCDKLTETILSQNGNPQVVQLKKGSKFQFGDVSAEVIGPIAKGIKLKKGLESRYGNNFSLVTMMTCGDTKFFTAGDIHEEQEKNLVAAYGSDLKADIMKLSHHGTSTANSKEIMKYIKPMYSFALNTNHTSITSENHQETYASKEHACEYGLCYMTGEEKKSIHIKVVNNKVSLYRYEDGKDTKMSGWVELKGGDGVNYLAEKFYLDKNSRPLTGLQKIGKKYYYFGDGGCLKLGHYDAKGVYNPWSAFGTKTRYIYKDGHLAMGFVNMKNRLYYFDKNGYKLNTNKSVELKKIEGKYYAVIKGGVLFTGGGKGGFRKFPDGHRYFNAQGVMQTGWKIYKGIKYYLDKDTGCRVTGFHKIDGVTYYFNNGGACKKQIDTSKIKGFKGSAGKRSISLVWKKNGNVMGYEIYISTKKNGGYKREAKITSRSVVKYTIPNLNSKQTYYVKIRSYIIANGETAKGDFGNVLKLKVK
ncbi:MAG: hypothetical protein HFI71_00770 [Lachnospiraceae bacterium]|nr:hypothetical protein [Lachnospiraceae bacterium]